MNKRINIKTPDELEEDYQLGLELEKIGYIRKDWYVLPEKLYGAKLINHPRNKCKQFLQQIKNI